MKGKEWSLDQGWGRVSDSKVTTISMEAQVPPNVDFIQWVIIDNDKKARSLALPVALSNLFHCLSLFETEW